MFDQFTVGAPAIHTSSTSNDISPCDSFPSSVTSPLPALDPRQKATSNITKLASQLDETKSQHDDISSSYLTTCSKSLGISEDVTFLQIGLAVDPKYEKETTLDSQHHTVAESIQTSQSSCPTSRVCQRLQRQLNSQLLCTHSQMKAISELVEEMVSTESQCNVTTSSVTLQSEPSPSRTLQLDELEPGEIAGPDPIGDEGYCEGDSGDDEVVDADALSMSLRRAAVPSGIRRHIPGAVFSTPRIRRKIVKRKRPGAGPEA